MPINADYRGPADLPEIIPVFPLPGALLLPRGQMPLNIFEPRYLAMVDDALRDGHRLIGMIQPDATHSPDSARPKLFSVGCVGRITQFAESGDGRYILELTGVSRFRVRRSARSPPSTGNAKWISSPSSTTSPRARARMKWIATRSSWC